MAKPRIFVSSTYIDLKHARRHIEGFIKAMGFDSVLFESGDIAFQHDQKIDHSCYAEIDNCHMLVLIIGGKYGTPASDGKDEKVLDTKVIEFYNSITRNEYETARKKGLPVFIFVEKGVFAEFQTYKKNKDIKEISYAHVDNVNIFRLIEDILIQSMNNYVKAFENFDDITNWLKEQWSGMFADFLTKRSTDAKLLSLQNQIEELSQISFSLKKYNEELLRQSGSENSNKIIQEEDEKIYFRKKQRFLNEFLISYLRGELATNGIVKDDDFIYNMFIETERLKDFCVNIEVDKFLGDEFYGSNGALDDYLILKDKY